MPNFMTYDNNCEEAPLVCYPVLNLDGEYQWNSSVEYGIALKWDSPIVTTYLDHFNIYRSTLIVKEAELIAEIPYTGATSYEYFDITEEQGEYDYNVTCVYIRDSEQCESEAAGIGNLIVTAVNENADDIQVYPNPTNGLLNVSGHGTMHISVSNLLGQTLSETTAEDNVALDLSPYGMGMYLIRIETGSGVLVQKVNVK